MTDTLTHRVLAPSPAHEAAAGSPRQLDWRRLSGVPAVVALVAAAIAATGTALGTVVAGQLVTHHSWSLVGWLTLCVVGGAVVNTAGRVLWSALSDRAEGQLRTDLVTAALHQPLEQLGEQAVGEILDRVDDDTHEVGNLVRLQLWLLVGTTFGVVPTWIVAGVTWWPAAFIYPAVAVGSIWLVRPLLAQIATLKTIEEAAWTDHAAALEEGIAGRDDLRTSLGQAHVIRKVAQLSAEIHRRFDRVVRVEGQVVRRSAGLLHFLIAAMAVAGALLVSGGDLGLARFVTLFLVTVNFVGQLSQAIRHLPDMQAGLGAVVRLRQMLAVEPEPVGGQILPEGPLDLSIRGLNYGYLSDRLVLRDVSMEVPAGSTVALVGRTGSGKSTLASLVSRAVEPNRGSVFIAGIDVRDLDLQDLRRRVGVVTQRTEILVGTLAENITLYASTPRAVVEDAIAELGLTDWVQSLPDGLDTMLGPGGTALSAGEEQLVAFARLLVRDVQVVVLDEATARMDPLTERRIVAAAERLLRGRTGIMIAHRLSTIERADRVLVLDHGRVLQHGPRTELAATDGAFRELLKASALAEQDSEFDDGADYQVGGRRRMGPPPARPEPPRGPTLARGISAALVTRPTWGLLGSVGFASAALIGSAGAITGLFWGRLVVHLQQGQMPILLTVLLIVSLVTFPFVMADCVVRYPRWWIEIMLRARMAALVGQTRQRRLDPAPPGEIVARSMDADRYVRYADRWVDLATGLIAAAVTGIAAGSWLAGAVPLAILVSAALASTLGRPIAGRSAAESSAARARFGRNLVSAMESVRTIKLAAATPDIHAHLQAVDAGRVDAAVREHRVQTLLDGVPLVMVQVGLVSAWAFMNLGVWGLATALLVSNAVLGGFDWYGRVAGAVVTEAPGTRAWQKVMTEYSGGTDLMEMPAGVDLVAGTAPPAVEGTREPLRRLELVGFGAVHDDGTIGVMDLDLAVEPGELVLLLGAVGSGKSSLLSAMAGLVCSTGVLRWNEGDVTDPETFLRPGQVAHIAQVPHVLSGTFRENVQLGFERPFGPPVATAQLTADVDDAGGPDSLVGHRGVRLSGGQVQRLALARALATDAELLLADDVSSALDARTEIELWQALRDQRKTVIGATSKRAALRQADRVVVLVDGRAAAVGPWHALESDWGHLAG
ncbi:MAG: ATP-binding cassette domain-containing protein [Marmoricola sp.]